MLKKPLKICCVGVSEHMIEHLIPSLSMVEGAGIHAIASRNAKKREAFEARYGVPSYDSWRRAIAESGSDAVFVAGPPEMNFQVVERCIDAMVPVFSEKPCGSSSKSVAQLLEKAIENRAIVQVGYNFRSSAAFENIISLQERFGAIKHMDVEFNSNKPDKAIWNTRSVEEAFLQAVAIHPIEMMSKICGENYDVRCDFIKLREPKFKFFFNAQGSEASMRVATGNNSQALEVVFRTIYESGEVATTDLGQPHRINILPSSKTPFVEGLAQEGKFVDLTLQRRALIRERYGQGYEAQIHDFIALVRSKKPNCDDLSSSVAAHRTLEMASWEYE